MLYLWYQTGVNIFLLKGLTIPYLVRNVWYLVRIMWLASRCTSHSLSALYGLLGLVIIFGSGGKTNLVRSITVF